MFGETREGNYHPSANPPKWITDGYANTLSGVTVNASTSQRLTAVYRAVNLLSNSVAILPLILYRKKGENRERDINNPLYDLLHDAPNPLMSSFTWRRLMMRHLLLRGNAYSQIIRDGAGDVIELWPLHPDKVSVEFSTENKLIYRVKVPGKEDAILFPEEVLHLIMDSEDGITGISPITTNADAIGGAIATENHSAVVFRNNANPAGVLLYPKALTPAKIEEIRVHWQKVYGGTDNAGKTAILEGGMEWKPVTVSSREAQMIEARKFGIEQIARIFGVPPHKLGHLENATFSNIEHQGIEYLTDGVEPYLVCFQQAIKQRILILNKDKKCYAEFLVDALLRTDSLARAQVQEIEIRSGTLNPDEARAQLNRNPRPDGKGKDFVTPTAPQQAKGSEKPADEGQDKPKEEGQTDKQEEKKNAARVIFEPIVRENFGRILRREVKKREQLAQKTPENRAEVLKNFYFEHRIYAEDIMAATHTAIEVFLDGEPGDGTDLEAIIAEYTQRRELEKDDKAEKDLVTFYSNQFMLKMGL